MDKTGHQSLTLNVVKFHSIIRLLQGKLETLMMTQLFRSVET